MPYTRCPHCRREQYVGHATLGLQIPCKNCGRAYPAKDDADEPAETLVPTESAFGNRPAATVLKSVGFVVLLVAVVGVVFWGIISLIRPAPKVADKKNVEAAVVEPRNAAREPAERAAWRADLEAEADRETRRTLISKTFVLLVAFYALYIAAIWYAGYWLAGDTAARGHTPLVWVGTYAVAQLFGRVIGYSLFVVWYVSPLEAALLAALLSFVFAELFSWAVFLIWLKVRPLGRLEYCLQCRRGKLRYAPKCPTCGSTD